MRIVLLALVVAALVVPTAVLAGSSSSASGAAALAHASSAKKGKKKAMKGKRQRNEKKASRSAKKAAKPKASRQADEREVKGVISALSATSVTVGAVTCAVPATASLTPFAVGDMVELTCDLVGGTWTLRKIEREDAAATGSQVEVKGTLTALGATIDVAGVSCAVPDGTNLSRFAVGDVVEMKCRTISGALTLYRVHKEDADGDEVEVKGAIAALGSGAVTVGTTTCAIPAGAVLAGFGVGDLVEMKCERVGGMLTLTRLESEDDDRHAGSGRADDDRSGHGSGDDDDDRSGHGSGDDDDDE